MAPRQKAIQAAQAASKRKTGAVHLVSQTHEERLRSALEVRAPPPVLS
jgi:hypothetical protein